MSLKSQEFGLSWFSLAWKGWTCLKGVTVETRLINKSVLLCKTNRKAKGVCVFCFFLNVQSTVQKYSVHRLQWGRKEKRDQFKKIKLNAKTAKCKMAEDSLIVWFKTCALEGSAEGNVTLKERILKGHCQVCTNCHWYRRSFFTKSWKLSPLLYCICSWSLWPTFTNSKQQR